MEHKLDRKPRKPAQDKTAPVNYDALHPASLTLSQQTADDQPTFAAVYRMLWPKLREERKWARSTAKQYDRVMAQKILPQMPLDVAFWDLDEDDFLTFWDHLCGSGLSQSHLQIASVVIRTIMELAYDQGLTQTTLWGLPQYRILPEEGVPLEILPCEDPEEEGARLADLAVRTPRSISLDVEFALAQGMIDNCCDHGELIAGLLMLCLGVRTSEATGFSYKHLVEVRPGYWALVRYEVSNKDARTTHAGGKTSNAFRLLPLPKFLTEILLGRKQELLGRFSPEVTENLPLACKGTDVACRCTQKEVNAKLKNLYRLAGVAEDLMRTAYQEMRADPDLAEDCEGRATAYLCRHQFATAMVYCGLTPGEIYTVMGHAEEDESVHKSDFANPDAFCALADKMSRRPLVQFFDHLAACHTYSCEDQPVSVCADGDVDLYFPSGGIFEVSLLGVEYGDNLRVETEGVEILRQAPLCLPGNPSDTISIRGALRALGEEAWRAAVDKTVVLPSPAAVVERLDHESALPSLQAIYSTANSRPQAVVEIPQPAPVAADKSDDQVLPQPTECVDIPQPVQQAVPVRAGRPEPKVFGMSAAPGSLYLLGRSGEIQALPDRQPIYNRNLAGKRLLDGQHMEPAALFCCREQDPALILSSDGMLYRLAPGQRLDSPDFCRPDNPSYQALRSGGILLQGPELGQSDGTITCLSDRGSIRRVSLERLRRISPEGRQLVTVPEGDKLVSACLCSAHEDLLIVSARGKVLRLAAKDLYVVISPGADLCVGMTLADEDHAVLCRPYKTDTEYLFVTGSGQAVRLAASAELMPHGRGSQGVRQVRVGAGDQIAALLPAAPAVFLAATNGKGLCIGTDSISVTTGAAKGVVAMKLRPPHAVLTAIGMEYISSS